MVSKFLWTLFVSLVLSETPSICKAFCYDSIFCSIWSTGLKIPRCSFSLRTWFGSFSSSESSSCSSSRVDSDCKFDFEDGGSSETASFFLAALISFSFEFTAS